MIVRSWSHAVAPEVMEVMLGASLSGSRKRLALRATHAPGWGAAGGRGDRSFAPVWLKTSGWGDYPHGFEAWVAPSVWRAGSQITASANRVS